MYGGHDTLRAADARFVLAAQRRSLPGAVANISF